MKRVQIPLLVLLVLKIMLILSAIPAFAQATKSDFVYQEILIQTDPPGKVQVSDDDILHLRDLTVSGPVWGELNGQLTVVANINQDTYTGNGTRYGTATLNVTDWNGLTCAFEGRSQWKYTNGMVSTGQFVGHGTGDFEGMQMMANFYDQVDHMVLAGTILNPHGN